MKQYLLGIDVGTTGTKAMLFSADGEVCGHAYRPYDLVSSRVNYNEQNAEDWWNAIVETVKEICSEKDIAENVAAISLSLQGGTVVPVDENMKPLRLAMVWNDRRCTEEHEEFLKEVGSVSDMYEKSGWMLGNGLPLLHLRWIKKHEPEIFAKAKMFLTVPDYVSYKMTGLTQVDMSNAGINQFTDIRNGKYDEKLLEFAGITEDQLPKIVHSGDVIGNLTEKAAKELGLTTKCVLVAGAHDQYAVMLGAGAVNKGDILIGSGTCWVVVATSDKPNFETGLSQSVAAIPGMWGSLKSLSSGGVCLEWLRKYIALGEEEKAISLKDIDARVDQVEAAKDKLFFYPFAGKSSKTANFQKGTFTGLDLSHDRFHMARAIMEGVVFQVHWIMDAFVNEKNVGEIKLTGGASKSRVWAQMVADIFGIPVRIPEVADMACVGAAIIAGTGCGIFESAEAGYKAFAVKEKILYPDAERVKMYAPLIKEYRRGAEILGNIYNL